MSVRIVQAVIEGYCSSLMMNQRVYQNKSCPHLEVKSKIYLNLLRCEPK
jgi:hypothetical protein